MSPSSSLPDLSHLAAEHTGGQLLLGEVLDVVTDALANSPRSRQAQIGPSEIGTECTRRLAYKLAGVTGRDRPGWKPAVGTFVHAGLADIFTEANRGRPARWLVETRVDVGTIGGQPVVGSADLFDVATGTVIDHKIVGTASLRAKRVAGHPGQQYAAQAMLYGRGFARRGLPVTAVAILALPQNGELSEAWWWTQPYDEQVAVAALARADVVASLVAAGGAAAAAALPTADSWCSWCSYYQPGASDLTKACPGHERTVQQPATLAEVLA